MSDDVTMPDMASAMLTALGPALEPTGEHKVLPDGYCPDCQGQCLRDWMDEIATSALVPHPWDEVRRR